MQLAEDVVIGPYCVVGKGVSIGAGTILDARVVITGAVQIGRENRLYPNCRDRLLSAGPRHGPEFEDGRPS